jgi:glycine/D-amino acid oxidase-like deaminating enzyme
MKATGISAAPILPNPALRLRAVRSEAVLPKAVDVVVIGGGIVGSAATWHLARRGLSVALCEKGVIAGEQSGRNWGWCRNTLRDPAELPLMRHSMENWRDPAVFGDLDTGFRTTGIMYFCGRSRNDEAIYENWLASVRGLDLDSRMVGGAEIERLLRGMSIRPHCALYTPSDGGAEPEQAAAAIAAAAQGLGASIHTHCAVRSIELQAGKVSGAITEQGPISCSAVLLAGGVWSRLFAGNLGIDLPMLTVRGSVMSTEPMPEGPQISAAGPRFGWRKRADGGYIVSQADATIFDIVPDSFRLFRDFHPLMASGLRTLRLRLGRRFVDAARTPKHWRPDEVSPFEGARIADPEPASWVLDEAARRLTEACPLFAGMKIRGRWAGLIDVTSDALPVIGPVAQLPGLFMATGFSGHGFGLGPGAGRLAADLISGDRPVVDPSAFSLARFPRARAALKRV